MVSFFSALKLEMILALSNLDPGKMSISRQWHQKLFAPQKHQQWFLERVITTCYRPILRKSKQQKRLPVVCSGTHQRWSHKIGHSYHKLKALNQLVWEGRIRFSFLCTFLHVKIFCYSAWSFLWCLIGGGCMEHIGKQIWNKMLQLLILVKKTKPLKGKSWKGGDPDRWNVTLFHFHTYLAFLDYFTWMYTSSCSNCRFLTSSLKYCPINQDPDLSVAVLTCALQLPKLVKRTERFAGFDNMLLS